MAKLECMLRGNLDSMAQRIDEGILRGISATREEESVFRGNGVRCLTRVYERYSALGGNRVSLTVTLFSCGEQTQLSAITTGGSQALFFKLNTWGEENFLQRLRNVIADYIV